MVRAELSKIIETNSTNDFQLIQPLSSVRSSPAPNKKFKSYTAQYDDEIDYLESNKNMTSTILARRELETYLQMKLIRCSYMGR